MFRKLSLAVAISGLLAPIGVHALGLGDIHLGSALNQRLNAEISVHLARTEGLGDIKIDLASPEAFTRAGVGRPFLLSGLTFTPVQNSDGETIIAVTSQEPIREPFLNFLVEVNWPKGRLVREYTILLDPPVTVKRAPAQIESPVAAPQVRARTTAPARAAAAAAGAREYGPVVVEDTLWNIASRMRVDGETVEQVMIALLNNNPDAFIHNNINRLKRGSILRLPASDDVVSLNRKEARSEFLAQTTQWREQNTITTPPATGDASPRAASGVAKEADRLKLASASKVATNTGAVEGSSGGSGNLEKLEQELMLVRETSEVARQEGDQLRTRVNELETQLQDIQRLLTLRNDQLAHIQVSQDQEPAAQEIAADTTEMAVDETSTPAAEPLAEAAAEESAEPSEVAEQQENVEPATETVATEAVAEVVPAAELEPEVVAPVEVATPPPAPLPVPVKRPAPSMMDSIFGNTALMAALGGAIALLLGLLTVIIRRRKSTEAEFAESILVAPKDAAIETATHADLSSTSTDETSLLSDFSPSDIDALQDETGEVDPLSEADVYVAYGRYQQAEELILQAIEKDDSRVELKFKLLEIHYSTQNKDAYIALAQRLADQGVNGKEPQAWGQVISMGHELAPTAALFGASPVEEGGDDEAPVENALDDLGELDDFDLGDLEAELGLDGDEDSLLNVDFEESITPDSVEVDRVEETHLEESTLDEEIDLPASLDEIGLGETELELGDVTDADETLDLDDLDLGGVLDGDESINLDDLSLTLDSELSLDDSESVDIASQLGGEEINLEGLGDELESLSDQLETDDFEITLDEMSSTIEDEITIEDEVAVDLGDEGLLSESDDMADLLADDDEVGTKLDLARAYADMGDKDGAENILQEVISEGTTEQKEQAEALIKSLS